jgi:Transposase DDE domain group 1
VVSQASGMLSVETVRKTGLDAAISAALALWRRPRVVHDVSKILLAVALAVALGGAAVGMLRTEPAVFGPVASDPTVSDSSTPSPRPD